MNTSQARTQPSENNNNIKINTKYNKKEYLQEAGNRMLKAIPGNES